MTEQEMWDAVQRCDADYDGVFFYAVRTTGIFCRPSCRSKPPRPENVCYFQTAEQARRAGFRPCKRCRSDLLDYRPMREIAEETRQRIEEAVKRSGAVRLDCIGLTPRRLTDVFRETYGVTPREYAAGLRLQAAKQKLAETEEPVIDIAYDTGFSSLSTFNRFFKRQTGQTPTGYRRTWREHT